MFERERQKSWSWLQTLAAVAECGSYGSAASVLWKANAGVVSKGIKNLEKELAVGIVQSADHKGVHLRPGTVLPACFAAIAKAAKEMGLTPEEHDAALADLAQEVERRVPQILTVLFVISQLPRIAAHARRHFLDKRGKSHHDAEELSQGVVLKILAL